MKNRFQFSKFLQSHLNIIFILVFLIFLIYFLGYGIGKLLYYIIH